MTGSSALVFAVLRGNLENVKYLLARGADVNSMVPLTFHRSSREDVASPLHRAVEHGQLAGLDALLAAGADTTLRDSEGRTAYEIAQQKRMDANVLAKLS